MSVRFWIKTAIAVVIVAAAGLGVCAAFRSLPHSLPSLSGRFGTGRLIYSWPVSGPAGQLVKRSIRIWVWYPTAFGAPGLPAPYASAERISDVEQKQRLWAIFSQDLSVVRTQSIAEAPLAPDRSEYPLVLLISGNGDSSYRYTALAEGLASDGWIVAGITLGPSDDSDPVSRTRRETVNSASDSPSSAAEMTSMKNAVRLSLDMLRSLNLQDTGRFSSRIDLNRLACIVLRPRAAIVSAVEAAAPNKTPIVAIGMQSGSIPQDATAMRPVLFVEAGDGAHPAASSSAEASGDGGVGTTYFIRGTTALSFTDLCYFFEPLLRVSDRLGSIDPDRLRTILQDMITTFVQVSWADSGEPDAARSALVAVSVTASQYPEVVPDRGPGGAP